MKTSKVFQKVSICEIKTGKVITIRSPIERGRGGIFILIIPRGMLKVYLINEEKQLYERNKNTLSLQIKQTKLGGTCTQKLIVVSGIVGTMSWWEISKKLTCWGPGAVGV